MKITEVINPIGTALQTMVQQDQDERNKYKQYLQKHGDWKTASKHYAADHKRNPDDLFNDSARLKQASRLIRANIDTIRASGDLLEKAWLLVQHMDNDIAFQQWFLQYLPKGSESYKYLHDRVAVNAGRKQEYGTQNQ